MPLLIDFDDITEEYSVSSMYFLNFFYSSCKTRYTFGSILFFLCTNNTISYKLLKISDFIFLIVKMSIMSMSWSCYKN